MFRKKMKSMRTLITRHIPLVCLSGLLLLLGACTKDDSGRAEPTGTLQLNLTGQRYGQQDDRIFCVLLYLRGSCDVCNGTTVSKALQYQC